MSEGMPGCVLFRERFAKTVRGSRFHSISQPFGLRIERQDSSVREFCPIGHYLDLRGVFETALGRKPSSARNDDFGSVLLQPDQQMGLDWQRASRGET